MTIPFYIPEDEAAQKKEKHKARELKNSQWWKRRRSQGICHYCQQPVPLKEMTMDHIVPISRGGKSVKGNVVPCCKTCNTQKRQLLPLEWETYMKKLKDES